MRNWGKKLKSENLGGICFCYSPSPQKNGMGFSREDAFCENFHLVKYPAVPEDMFLIENVHSLSTISAWQRQGLDRKERMERNSFESLGQTEKYCGRLDIQPDAGSQMR